MSVINKSTVVMNDGAEIRDCVGSVNGRGFGGGIFVDDSTFIMNGGQIIGCVASKNGEDDES